MASGPVTFKSEARKIGDEIIAALGVVPGLTDAVSALAPLATSAKQDTAQTSLSAIDTKLGSIVTALALLHTDMVTANGHLATIETNTTP